MPQIKSAKKSLRQNARKRAVNDRWRRLLHDTIHTFGQTISQNKPKETPAAFTKAQSAIDRASRHGIIHRNKAARLKSKLSQAVKKTAL